MTKTFIIESKKTSKEICVFTVTADSITRCAGRADGSLVFKTGDQSYLLHVVDSQAVREIPGAK